jgi:hypothetical protein
MLLPYPTVCPAPKIRGFSYYVNFSGAVELVKKINKYHKLILKHF